jgi:rare lipoprotein A
VVQVRNPLNGKTVEVTINDRGPFVKDRIIDLSYRAAQLLGIVHAGRQPVEVQRR